MWRRTPSRTSLHQPLCVGMDRRDRAGGMCGDVWRGRGEGGHKGGGHVLAGMGPKTLQVTRQGECRPGGAHVAVNGSLTHAPECVRMSESTLLKSQLSS